MQQSSSNSNNNEYNSQRRGSKGNACEMSYQLNVNELCMSDIKPRISYAPQWVKKMPVQGQRRWLLMSFPDQYKIGTGITGAIAGHKKHRGVWSVNEARSFRESYTQMADINKRIDWTRVAEDTIPSLKNKQNA